MDTEEITTILGPGSSFEGKLTFEGAVRIDGRFRGQIDTQGTLIVGPSATLDANVSARCIVVQGQVTGDLRAAESLELHAPARVRGNLTTPSLHIERGALFHGQAAMLGEDEAAAAPRTSPEIASARAAADAPAESAEERS